MHRFFAESVLRLPVRMNSIHLGHAVDVVLDRDVRRILGLDVRCGDDAHRFLPLSAARIETDEIAIASILMLLDVEQLAFYRKRGTTLRTLRGAAVSVAGRTLGPLHDVVGSSEGAITHVVIDDGRRIAVDDTLRIGSESRRVDAA